MKKFTLIFTLVLVSYLTGLDQVWIDHFLYSIVSKVTFIKMHKFISIKQNGKTTNYRGITVRSRPN